MSLERYKGVMIKGSTFPDDPYRRVPVKLNSTMQTVYLPALQKALPDAPKGLKLLITAMTHMEGFTPKSRSFRTNNPGNVGNTDNGANRVIPSLEDGIRLQAEHIKRIAEGKSKNYPMGKKPPLPPFYSPEIAKNQKTYGIPPYLPGYDFIFTGQLDQFIKIYSTGARVTNSYLNVIVSYFADNSIAITPETKLQHIINLL